MENFADPALAEPQIASEAGSNETASYDDGDGNGSAGESPNAGSVLQMAAQSQSVDETPSASQLAFDKAKPGQAAAKPHGTNSHNGGFTGFGAEYQPCTFTDPHYNHAKVDAALGKLGVQHTRIFVPAQVVDTGLNGQSDPDIHQQRVLELEQAVANHPGDAKLKTQLAAAKQLHAKDVSFTNSFMKTVELAGKDTTINLTFLGAVGQPERTQRMAHILKYFSDHGFRHLQVTLENEPNGGTAKGDGYRSVWNRAAKSGNVQRMHAAAQKYVDAYATLHKDLTEMGVRDRIKIVGGDMVGQNRAAFFRSIVADGMNKFVDAYSLHIYWGLPGHPFSRALDTLREVQQLAAKLAPGKSMQVTEFGRKEKGPGGNAAAPRNLETAFEEGLFALSAVNDGYTGLVKWDAFWGGEHHKGDGKGDPGKFYMINPQYKTDAMFSLMEMFTHAVEPGWLADGANHQEQGAEVRFRSQDGHRGALLAMSRSGKSIATHALPPGKLSVTVWSNGRLHTAASVPHGHDVHVPAMGAVAVTSKPA